MEVMEAIQSRRSIRRFKEDAVPEDYITEIIEAARLAPSGTNLQPTRFVVIKSKEMREKLNEGTPLPFVTKAPVVIACCVDKNSIMASGERMKELTEAKAFEDTPLDKKTDDNKDKDDYNKRRSNMSEAALKAYMSLNLAIAVEHMILRATDLGLGSCWIMMVDGEKTKSILELDERYDVVALVPIGYADQAPSQRPRLPIDELIIKQC
jgi:nitroreductase